jgi:hypothetical protein
MSRQPGRPPLDPSAASPSTDVHLRVPASDYDRAEQVAKARRESVQDVIRRGLKQLLLDERTGPF